MFFLTITVQMIMASALNESCSRVSAGRDMMQEED